jgi:hypothetical protein
LRRELAAASFDRPETVSPECKCRSAYLDTGSLPTSRTLTKARHHSRELPAIVVLCRRVPYLRGSGLAYVFRLTVRPARRQKARFVVIQDEFEPRQEQSCRPRALTRVTGGFRRIVRLIPLRNLKCRELIHFFNDLLFSAARRALTCQPFPRAQALRILPNDGQRARLDCHCVLWQWLRLELSKC